MLPVEQKKPQDGGRPREENQKQSEQKASPDPGSASENETLDRRHPPAPLAIIRMPGTRFGAPTFRVWGQNPNYRPQTLNVHLAGSLTFSTAFLMWGMSVQGVRICCILRAPQQNPT